MKHAAGIVVALVAGAAAGAVAGIAAAPDPPPRDDTTAAAVAQLGERLDQLAATVRAGRVDAPRAAVAPEPSPNPDVPAPASAPSAPEPTADALRKLEARVTALEGRATGVAVPADLSGLPVAQLQNLSRALMGEKRHEDLLRVATELSQRGELTSDQRADAELDAGYALRGLGRHADAEQRFRDTLARVGDRSEKGAWVAFQIGWERSYQKDAAGAAAEMERAADNPAVSPVVRVHALYNAGRFAKDAGDPARARAHLERLLAHHAGDIPASQQFMKTEAERMLKELEGR